MKTPKIIVWDIETTDFKADRGELLCIGYQILGQKKVYCPRIYDFEDEWFNQKDGLLDRQLLEHIVPILSDADMWVTHNGKGFDLKFVNTRLMIQGMPPLPPIPHTDTYHNILKNQTALRSRKLGYVAETMGFTQQKGKLTWNWWKQAMRGYQPAIKMIADYCQQDIRTTVELYEKFRPLHPGHPNLSLVFNPGQHSCPRCMSTRMEKRGRRTARRTGTNQRYQCKDCGGWSQTNVGKKKEGILS